MRTSIREVLARVEILLCVVKHTKLAEVPGEMCSANTLKASQTPWLPRASDPALHLLEVKVIKKIQENIKFRRLICTETNNISSNNHFAVDEAVVQMNVVATEFGKLAGRQRDL